MLRDPRAAFRSSESAPLAFASMQLSRTYFPGWALFYSFLIHAVILTVLLSLPVIYNPPEIVPPPQAQAAAKGKQYRVVMFLPAVGGGGPGRRGESTSAGDKPSAAPSSGTQGLVHPGRQEIRSDPPSPTNDSQTILQPGPEKLPVLESKLELPNLISKKEVAAAPPKPRKGPPPMVLPRKSVDLPQQRPVVDFQKLLAAANVGSLFQPIPPKPAVGLPDTLDPEKLQSLELSDGAAVKTLEKKGLADLPLRRPKLDLPKPVLMTELPPRPPLPPPPPPEEQPEAVESKEQSTVEPEEIVQAEEETPAPTEEGAPEEAQPEPEPQQTTEASKPVPLASLPVQGKDWVDLLVLNATPKWPEKPVAIPKAESRGRFAVSPQPQPGTGDKPGSTSIAPGSSADPGTPGKGAGGGGGEGEAAGDGSGGTTGPGEGSGSGAGTGPGQGPFAGITVVGGIAASGTPGTGSGGQPFAGITVVGGSGGSSVPNPAPSQPFAGISVVGGVGATESAVNVVPIDRTPRPVQTDYGVTVLSTEESGGGLPYFGVFSDEQVHTVYVDMRKAEADAEDVWTLEFAEPRGASAPLSPTGGVIEIGPGFVKPVPTVKERPALPQEVVGRHLGEMVVAYAVISVEGKLEQLSIQQSPDPLLDPPVLEALGKWRFLPGSLNGDAVAVKVLLGIPLRLPSPPG